MTDGELERRFQRTHRQIAIQAWTEYARIAVLSASAFALIILHQGSGDPGYLLASCGFICLMWSDYFQSKVRWKRLEEWLDRENAETLRLAMQGEME